MKDISEFSKWLKSAKDGDVAVYLTAEYAHGSPLADAARAAAEAGQVTLFQRRVRSHLFAYQAMKIPMKLGKKLAPHWKV